MLFQNGCVFKSTGGGNNLSRFQPPISNSSDMRKSVRIVMGCLRSRELHRLGRYTPMLAELQLNAVEIVHVFPELLDHLTCRKDTYWQSWQSKLALESAMLLGSLKAVQMLVRARAPSVGFAWGRDANARTKHTRAHLRSCMRTQPANAPAQACARAHACARTRR